jgi:hypothetical protein
MGPSGITLLVSGFGYVPCGLLPPAAAAGFEACGPRASSCGACGPQASYGSGAAGHQERAWHYKGCDPGRSLPGEPPRHARS